MKLASLAAPAVALGLLVGAKAMGAEANAQRARWPRGLDEPFAPSPKAAGYVSLGYREFMADLLWVRVLAYFGLDGATSAGVRQPLEAIAALDPAFEEPQSWGALAMQSLTMNLTQDDYRAVVRVLEAAMERFPRNYRFPLRAGELYAIRLTSEDPVEQRRLKERGAQLLARAVRMPGAPDGVGTFVAHLQTQLGQRDQAVRDLRELYLYARDTDAKRRIAARLAKLLATDSESLAYELDHEKKRFETAWQRERPEIAATDYVVLGPALAPWFDLADLVDEPTVVLEPITPLPPLSD